MVTAFQVSQNYGSPFFGYTTVDDAIAKTRKVWDAVWARLGNEKPLMALFRNPYDPLENPGNQHNLHKKPEGKEGLGILLDQFATTRTLPLLPRTGRPYHISGIVYLDSQEMIEVNIASREPIGSFYPENFRPALVKAWVFHYVPPYEGITPRFDAKQLASAALAQ